MVTRPAGRSGGTVDPVSDNGAGQDRRWQQRGLKATAALAETWGALAEVCHELSTTEWGLPTECPGWDVKDQLSHLIGIERSLMGEPAPAWDGPLGDAREERRRRHERALDRRAAAAAGRRRAGRVRGGDRYPAGPARRAHRGGVGRRRGGAPSATCPTRSSWRCGSSTAGCTSRMSGARWTARVGAGTGRRRCRSTASRAPCPSSSASRRGAPTAPSCASRCRGRVTTHAPSPSPSRAAGPGRSATRSRPTVTLALSSLDFVRLGCGRATAAQVEAAGGVALSGDAAVGRRVLGAMNFMF